MFEILASLGAVLAGLILLAREGLPLAKALRDGTIITSRGERIQRSAEPDRFNRWVKTRRGRLVLPICLMAGGALWLGWIYLILSNLG